ncbi:MAG: regulatory iron-sulfur-containing complex subunit RicT [Bacilli bacterium]
MKIVRIRLLESSEWQFFDSFNFDLHEEDKVVVETVRGLQIGNVEELYEKESKDVGTISYRVLRLATIEDLNKFENNKIDGNKAFQEAKKIAKNDNLKMRFIDASFNFDRTQLLFHFVADERVDFRELAKKLAQIYRTRIELRQIGVRDKAKKIGGIGPCGLFLCCNQFLTDFTSVSISMAKNQLLALNPTKINGSCGRLLCCLNYEDEIYSELKKLMPCYGSFIETPQGSGKVIGINLMKQTYQVQLQNNDVIVLKIEEPNGSIK